MAKRKQKNEKSMKSYRLRIYPKVVEVSKGTHKTVDQTALIEETFDVTCWFYNQLLTIQKQRYAEDINVRVSRNDFTKLVSAYRKANPRLKDVDSTALKNTCVALVRAYDNFFQKRAKFPKFHKRRFTNSYTASGRIAKTTGKSSIHFTNENGDYQIRLPKLGLVDIKGSRFPTGPIKTATITHESTGRYYVSVQVERTELNQEKPLHPVSKRANNADIALTGKVVGLDINIPHIDFSDDHPVKRLELETPEEAKHLRLWERRLARRRLIAKQKQQQLDHQVQAKLGTDSDWYWWESKSYQEAKQHVAKLKAHQAHRRDLLFQRFTTQLIQEYDTIVVEDLSVNRMLKDHRHAKHISEISPNRFITMLEYKAKWHDGKRVIRVDPKFTSQTCYDCGFVMGTEGTEKLGLNVREWTCPKCHVHHLRDKNAARNILKRGLDSISEES